MMPVRPPVPARLAAIPAALAAIILAVAACSGAGAPVVSFDPTGRCTSEGQQPGAYPELEALLPDKYDDERPANVDSGRTCTPASLGTLAAAGVEELKFAGATWNFGGTSGMTLAVFEADGLDAAMMREFYEAGAGAARRTEKVAMSDTTVGGAPAKRLDVLGSDGTGQTVVAWPAGGVGRVWVLLAADVGDSKVVDVLETLGSR